jgi:hypothetical protein
VFTSCILQAKLNGTFSASRIAESFSAGWTVTYEIWTIDTRKTKAYLSIDVDNSEMSALLFDSMDSWHWDEKHGLRFEFPASISQDLQRFVFLSKHISICRAPSPTGGGLEWTYKEVPLDKWCGRDIRRKFRKKLQGTYLYSYHAWFSPCGDFVLMLRPEDILSPKCIESSYCPLEWEVAILTMSQKGDVFQLIECLEISLLNIESLDYRRAEDFARMFCFHPSLPLMALSMKSQTVLWSFGKRGKSLGRT